MAYVVIFERPDGPPRFFCQASGDAPDCLTENANHAIRFDNMKAAAGAARNFCGYGPAFWESERDSQKIARRERGHWQWRVEPTGPGAIA